MANLGTGIDPKIAATANHPAVAKALIFAIVKIASWVQLMAEEIVKAGGIGID